VTLAPIGSEYLVAEIEDMAHLDAARRDALVLGTIASKAASSCISSVAA
jgi:hypothetical protein